MTPEFIRHLAVRATVDGSNLQRQTEARGEANAADYIYRQSQNTRSPWHGYEMERGYCLGAGIDQIWVRRDRTRKILGILIVEAKGRHAKTDEAAKLGTSASKGLQMSKAWVLGSALELRGAHAGLGSAIVNAIHFGAPPTVHGLIVTGTRLSNTQTIVTAPQTEPFDPITRAAVYHRLQRTR